MRTKPRPGCADVTQNGLAGRLGCNEVAGMQFGIPLGWWCPVLLWLLLAAGMAYDNLWINVVSLH